MSHRQIEPHANISSRATAKLDKNSRLIRNIFLMEYINCH